MAHPNPIACRDTVLYKIVGRAAPHPIDSCTASDPDAPEKLAAKLVAERAKSVAGGHEVSFITVQGHGKSIDDATAKLAEMAERMASLEKKLQAQASEIPTLKEDT